MTDNGFNLICTATVAASDPVGTVDVVNMATDPIVSTVTELTVPQGEYWVIDDLYITAAADSATSNPVIQVEGNRSRVLLSSPLASTLITNQSRVPLRRKIILRAQTILAQKTLTTVANDATADSIRFEEPMVVFPSLAQAIQYITQTMKR